MRTRCSLKDLNGSIDPNPDAVPDLVAARHSLEAALRKAEDLRFANEMPTLSRTKVLLDDRPHLKRLGAEVVS